VQLKNENLKKQEKNKLFFLIIYIIIMQMKQQNYNKTATIYKDSLTQDVKLAPLPKLNHAAKAYIDQATGGGGGSHHRSESKKEIEKEKTVNHPPPPPCELFG
jgi:hypothetical protein